MTTFQRKLFGAKMLSADRSPDSRVLTSGRSGALPAGRLRLERSEIVVRMLNTI